MVYFKFLYSKEAVEKIKESKFQFEKLFIPNSRSQEKYCFIEIDDETTFIPFLELLPEESIGDSEVLPEESQEWPDHPFNFDGKDLRIRNFTIHTLKPLN